MTVVDIIDNRRVIKDEKGDLYVEVTFLELTLLRDTAPHRLHLINDVWTVRVNE